MSSLGWGVFDLDLLIVCIAYIILEYGQTPAWVFAFGQGLLVDQFSGGLQGLFTCIYLGVFGSVYLGCRFFNLDSPKGQMILVALAGVAKHLLFMVILWVFSLRVVLLGPRLFLLGASVMVTALSTPVVFYLFDALRQRWEDRFPVS